MIIILFLACLTASTVGGISGIGGGILIKPVLDAIGTMSVSAVSFLSSLTVLSMSCVALLLRHKYDAFTPDQRGTFLAAGAALGGVLGQQTFGWIKGWVGKDSLVGMVQAIVLAIAVVAALLYTMLAQGRWPGWRVIKRPFCAMLGMALGMVSAFLGIGGGPLNLVVLYAFFDMNAQEAAANSLHIICLSQVTNLLVTLLRRQIPEVPILYLVIMVTAGILGGRLGSMLHHHLDDRQCTTLFCLVMIFVILICVYNAIRFAIQA